jgi:hypothetical protein
MTSSATVRTAAAPVPRRSAPSDAGRRHGSIRSSRAALALPRDRSRRASRDRPAGPGHARDRATSEARGARLRRPGTRNAFHWFAWNLEKTTPSTLAHRRVVWLALVSPAAAGGSRSASWLGLPRSAGPAEDRRPR